MQEIKFNGWRALRLANDKVELVVTRDVGPRIMRFAFLGGPNIFRELAEQQGGRGEQEWMIRGGHRLWVAPEGKPRSYEIDNDPYESAETMARGVRVRQAPGPITGIAKQMEISLAESGAGAVVRHTLTNSSSVPVRCAPWALTVMGAGGQAIIPLPDKIPHGERLTHNQNWSIWSYTDLSDPRWSFGRDYLLFRHDAARGPSKIGLAHREGWVAYQRERLLFVKRFERLDDAAYPDGDVNFETYADRQILEIESLGPLVWLKPGESVSHAERWELHDGVPRCRNEEDVARLVKPLIK